MSSAMVSFSNRAEDIHQYVAKDGHTQRDDVYGALGEFLRQQRNDQQTHGRATAPMVENMDCAVGFSNTSVK